jgi:hypothetical protein
MSKGLPTFVRRDRFTGPLELARVQKASCIYKYIPKQMLNQVDGGSREHFFHFLLGYLLPLVHLQSKYRFKRFLVLDCGPLLSPVLDETLARLGYSFDIVGPGEIQKPCFLDPWDYGWIGRRTSVSVSNAVYLIRKAWKEYACLNGDCPPLSENLLIKRSSPHQFYLDGSSEIAGYGTSRRGMSNLDEVSNYLNQNNIHHAIYEPGAHCLGCQIQAFSTSKRLLGFRGAEWANLIWSTPGTRVRMLDHDPPAKLVGDLMTTLGIQHEFAIVETAHSPEHPHEALRFFREE